MSQEELANATDNRVSAQEVIEYEEGLRDPDGQALVALAETLLVSQGYFFREPRINLVGEGIDPDMIRAIDLLERYAEIAGIVGPHANEKPLKGLIDHVERGLFIRSVYAVDHDLISMSKAAELLNVKLPAYRKAYGDYKQATSWIAP